MLCVFFRSSAFIVGVMGVGFVAFAPVGRAADVIDSKVSGYKLKLIPAGDFLMGSNKDEDKNAIDDEAVNGRKHSVRITRPYYLGITEVTRAQFRRVVEASGLTTDAERDGKGGFGWNDEMTKFEQNLKFTWRNAGFTQTDEHPVMNVTWNDAVAFCNALSKLEELKPYYQTGDGKPSGGDAYRLPTEAEWEYACRAGTNSFYGSGDDPETLAKGANIADGTAKQKYRDWRTIVAEDGYVYTAPVGRFKPNAWGLFDMHGNVSEWCGDWYEYEYYKDSPPADPTGPANASWRVHRGGSWSFPPDIARVAYRGRNPPTYRLSSLGFRLARDQSGK